MWADGVPREHPPEIRAAAVAAVLAGEQQSVVAKRFGVSRGRLHDWVQRASVPSASGTAIATSEARTRERMAGLIYDTLVDTLTVIRDQLQIVSREDWVEKQSARDLAELVGKEFDGAIRLLAGFRPAEPAAVEADILELDAAPVGDAARDDRPAD